MSVLKITEVPSVGDVVQQANFSRFANHFEALQSAIAAGDAQRFKSAVSDFTQSFAMSSLSGFGSMQFNVGIKEAMNALKYQARAGNLDGARPVLQSLRQGFGAPVEGVSGTDLRSMANRGGSVAGTDLRTVQLNSGAVAGTDLRNVTVASAAGSGIDLRAMPKGRSGPVAGTDLRELTVASSAGSGIDLRAMQMGRFGDVAGTDLRATSTGNSSNSGLVLKSVRELMS